MRPNVLSSPLKSLGAVDIGPDGADARVVAGVVHDLTMPWNDKSGADFVMLSADAFEG